MPGKSKRTSKTSKGERRSSRNVALTPVQRVNMGGGILASFKPIGTIRTTQR